jgi:predicted DNA binding CopG/RHH family protein
MGRTLDKYERSIEKSADSYRAVTKKKLRRIENILNNVRKSRNINIRISEQVLVEIKKRSQHEGIPYQTLISSVLHKFVTNQLVDEKAISKSMQLLTSRRHKAVV